MRTFFVSDTHFSHLNILKYEPIRIKMFLSNITEEEVMKLYEEDNQEELIKLLRIHDEEIIKRWNAKVSNDDIVWFLGDWGMGNREHIKELIKRLNGKIKMIMGNHDNRSKSWYEEIPNIAAVYEYPVLLKHKFILSHAPIEEELGFFYNIFGHVHSNEEFATETQNTRCVCLERTNGEPIELEYFDKYRPIEKNINKETNKYEKVDINV